MTVWAGMVVGRETAAALSQRERVGLGRNAICRRRHMTTINPTIIPAPHRHSCPSPSFPRKRESTPRPYCNSGLPGFWIPAYAGMTVGELPLGTSPLPAGEGWVREKPTAPPTLPMPSNLTVIPAKAGIHTPPILQFRITGVLDSGLRRNDGGGRVGAFSGGAARPVRGRRPPPSLPAGSGCVFRRGIVGLSAPGGHSR